MKQCFLLSFVLVTLFCSGCLRDNQKPLTINGQLRMLPPDLQKDHFSLDELLKDYDNLDEEQRAIALEHFLTQANLSRIEQSRAGYVLARIYQQAMNKNKNKQTEQSQKKRKCEEILALFNSAKADIPLRINAIWHISEIATICGDEKLVRQALNDLIAESDTVNNKAAIQYAFAQSYLRANQIERAVSAFQQLRIEFPDTNYALGAAYYLGTASYKQFDNEYKLQDQEKIKATLNANPNLKRVLTYYLEYLERSPAGHFALEIIAKIENLSKLDDSLIKADKYPTIANAYFLQRQYKSALNYWLKADANKYNLELANCYFKLGQNKLAQDILFKNIDKYPSDKRYLSLAQDLSERLNKTEALKLWENLYKHKTSYKDEVIWNLAIRKSQSQALTFYQQIVTHYSDSDYAPEAQWRLFWQRIRQNKDKSPGIVANWCAAAAKKYSRSRLSPRFLFWAGKLSENVANKQAEIYYQQIQELYPTNYYGQRGKARYDYLKFGKKDNYFELQPSRQIGSREWDWPFPNKILQTMQIKEQATVTELIYLKQYDELTAQNLDLPVEVSAWLKGKTKQAMAAINTAAKVLQEEGTNDKSANLYSNNLLKQYSYPLLYNKEIANYCSNASITDPLFLQALIREESRYEPRAISSAKALGLCQLMPATAITIAKNWGINIIDTSQLFDPDLNIKLGSLYLASVLKDLNNNALWAIASYNAGSATVKRQIESKQNTILRDVDYFVEDFPYRETREYIRKVFGSYHQYKEIYR